MKSFPEGLSLPAFTSQAAIAITSAFNKAESKSTPCGRREKPVISI
jgi:hypothetical protein